MAAADLASSFESFLNAAAEFFGHLSDIHWTSFALALGFLAAMQLARAWAWRNVLRAAYPGDAHLLPAPQRRLPRRGGDQRDRPGARRAT